jgi:nucleotide-binding universal stress UspA family protein
MYSLVVCGLGDATEQRRWATGLLFALIKVLVDASDGADLLVMGNRGHGGFAGMPLGSVSVQVLAYAHCPTVIVRA